MSKKDDDNRRTDDHSTSDGLALDRRSALKGGVAGFAALGLGSLSSQPVAAHLPADKVGGGGSTSEIMEVSKNDSQNHSELHSLLGPYEAKYSQGEDIVLQSALETALLTKVKVTGKDSSSTAEAGILGWVEMDGQMVTVDGGRQSAPSSAGDLFDSNGDLKPAYADGVVTFNNRAFNLQASFSELDDDEFISSFIRTRSTHGFNWLAVDAGGEYTNPGIEVKGVLTVFVDDKNAEASAAVRNRTLVTQPVKLPHSYGGH